MELALVTFKSLFSTLYPDVTLTSVVNLQTVDEDEEMTSEIEVEQSNPTGVSGIGVKVVANSLDELREPDKSNAKPAVKILAALIASSSTFFDIFFNRKGLLTVFPFQIGWLSTPFLSPFLNFFPCSRTPTKFHFELQSSPVYLLSLPLYPLPKLHFILPRH